VTSPQSSKGPLAALVLGSAVLMAFLGNWEGRAEFTVYADKLAHGLPTVCKGLTHYITTTPIVVGEVWPAAKCEAEERQAVIGLQRGLVRCFKSTPPQNVFDAATSHAWNNGLEATCGSSAMRAWNAGDWALGCRRLALSDSGKPVWSYVKTGRVINGKAEYKFVRGLANRRAAERELCEKPDA